MLHSSLEWLTFKFSILNVLLLLVPVISDLFPFLYPSFYLRLVFELPIYPYDILDSNNSKLRKSMLFSDQFFFTKDSTLLNFFELLIWGWNVLSLSISFIILIFFYSVFRTPWINLSLKFPCTLIFLFIYGFSLIYYIYFF